MTIKADELLQHYTDEAGFAGIVRSQTIWACEFLSMEDTSEWTFPLEKLAVAASQVLQRRIPTDVCSALGIELGAQHIPGRIAELKDQIRKSDGYGSLFIACFARSQKQHERDDGILSLWRHYTKYKGVCLEYRVDHLREKVRSEAMFWSYGMLVLAEVQYGVDETSETFKQLAEQFALHMQISMYKAYKDRRLAPNLERPLFEQRFLAELIQFCATHKHPSFEDEREVRIVAIPAPKAQFQVLMPPQHVKQVRVTSKGRRYIPIGEFIPGLLPDGVIVGPHCTLKDGEIEALYPPMTPEGILIGEEWWRTEAKFPRKPPHRKSKITV